ncbi:MAG: hypothetical protein JWQ09_4735 [Segetibacter sp.]|nr:hypothetical protein [Segetibacter sp.]
MLVLFEKQNKKSFFIRLTRVIRVPSFSQKDMRTRVRCCFGEANLLSVIPGSEASFLVDLWSKPLACYQHRCVTHLYLFYLYLAFLPTL